MTAARREKKIKALILMAAPGSTGAALLLEQQQRQLAQMTLSDADRQQKIELQKKIQQAVITGKGWEGIPPAMRRQADTPEFRSVLLFDPSQVMQKIEQPVLILQGDLDTSIPPTHAERLAELGRARKKERITDVVHFSGLGHAFTADSASTVDSKVTEAISDWLKKIW
jgi:pimeloyl-ACP methyl ester carboxylesterase